MTIEGALLARLQAVAGLTALVGTRIYVHEAHQGDEMPLVTFQRISSTRAHLFNVEANVRETVWQFDCYGRSHDEAADVADQVEAALSRWAGTEDGTVVQLVLIESDTDLRDPDASPVGTTDTGSYRRMIEARVFYEA